MKLFNQDNSNPEDAKVEELVAKLASKKSDSLPDESFSRALKMQLDSEISKLNIHQNKTTTINFNFMKNFKFVLPVAALVVLLIVFVSLPHKQPTKTLSGKQQITKINDHGFGDLNQLSAATGQGGGGGNSPEMATNDRATAAAPMAANPSFAAGMGGGVASKLFVPINYHYVYKGDDFTVDSAKMDVYQRQKGFGNSIDLNSILDKFNSGLFNINKFSSASLDYLQASENRQFGYSLYIDLKQGSININQNWEQWPQVQNAQPMTINQVPADDQVIAAANQFLDEYGIDRNNYGEPIVQNSWRIMYEQSPKSMPAYIPDMLTIVYPFKIGDKEIYDEGGNKSGMYVTLNLRDNKVSSVGEISNQQYNASQYDTEQDTSKLIKLAEAGGYQNYIPFATGAPNDSNVQTRDLELGTPSISYVRLWQNLNGQSRELFVPSLVFPIKNPPDDFYQKNITVPLIKEVLDSRNQPQPTPLPLDLVK